jgi:hypothetical protein
MRTHVNKLADFLERTLWTAAQAAAAAAIATGFDNWSLTAKVAGIAAVTAALKVIAAQNIGKSNDGALPSTTETETP